MKQNHIKKFINIVQEKGFRGWLYSFVRFSTNQFDPGYHRRFRFHTQKNWLLNRIRYDAPPNPYKTIKIRPSEIDRKLGIQKVKDQIWLYPPPRHGGIGQTKSGTWDNPKYQRQVDELPRIIGFRQRFVENKNWKETEYYDWLREKTIESKVYKKRGFQTAENYISKHFENYEELYFDIVENGYISGHKETRKEPGKRASPNNKDTLEVMVCIDRNGTIYLAEGHHRFAIARILDLEIPAHVIVRHEKWQKLREKIYKKGLYKNHEELRNHPDLQDIKIW